MSRGRLTLLSLLALLAVGCLWPAISPSPTPGARPATLGEPTRLKVGEVVSFDSGRFELGFIELIEDSRCPSDVVCIAMGAARLRVFVRLGPSRSDDVLRTDASEPARFGPYSVSLTAVEPYPRSNIRIDPRGYLATIVVKKS